MPSNWNIFQIGRIAGKEDQLTEMLVWLTAVVPDVTGPLLRLAFGESAPIGDVEVKSQHGIVGGRLDMFISSPTCALVIESKLGSTYGEGQIKKYLEWLAKDFGECPTRGLMTLTAREARWLIEDLDYAAASGLVAAERRWEELHDALTPLAEQEDSVGARLVGEFLEMLSGEGLIPMRPLDKDELETAWADGWTVVRRYREFFHACTGQVGEALGATPLPRSGSDRGDWFWQDYAFDDGIRVAVGVFYTDEQESIPRPAIRRSPILWLAAQADQVENWPRVATWLETHPPEGWLTGSRWYGERPSVWRPLSPLLAGADSEQQREALASAAAVARPWIDEALENAAGAPGET